MIKKALALTLAVALLLSVSLPAWADITDAPVYYTNFNTAAVSNAPEYFPDFTVEGGDLLVQSVTTYHWNGGKGSAPGAISIYDWDDNLVGTWDAVGRSGSGAQNVYWDVFPGVTLKNGTRYYVIASDTKTWSQNSGSGGYGFVEVRGTHAAAVSQSSEQSQADAQTEADAVRQRAEAGDAEAMLRLGEMYYYGNGVDQSYSAAAAWYYNGAVAGNPEAMYNVGYVLYYGIGTDQNKSAAIKWFDKSAAAGDPYALYYVATLYKGGDEGKTKNMEKARDYFYRAAMARFTPYDLLCYYGLEAPTAESFDTVLRQANEGDSKAMCDLAYLYYYGIGTEKNDALAAYWWYVSAEAGEPLAMYDVAYMFANGFGSDQNTKEAERWIKKFASMDLDSLL